MAEVTQFVCDACGLGQSTRKGPVEQLNLEFTGEQPFSIKADVHNNARCINTAVKTQVAKHFNQNGASPLSE